MAHRSLVSSGVHDQLRFLKCCFRFSAWGWSDCAGMAYVFGMCGSVSSGVNQVSEECNQL